MTPEQALQILDQATAALEITRQQHAQILQALETLKKLAKEKAVSQGQENPGAK